MSPQRFNSSSHDVVIVLSTRLIRKSVKGLTNLNELFMGFLIVGIVLRVVFQSKSTIRFLYLVHRSILGHLKNIIVRFLFIGIVLLKEFLLIFVLHPMLIEESFEGFLSIIDRVMLGKHLIIMCSFISVGKHFISLTNVIELLFGILAIFFMAIWMPVGGQLLVRVLNLE